MAYININNPANYQLQEFGQMGFRVIDSDHLNVDGETYRTIYVVQDAVVTALTAKGDDITSKALLAGTLLHGLFSDVSVTSGKVLAYMAGRLTAQEILDLYKAYVIANGGTLELESETLSKLQALGTDDYADASLVLMPSGYKTSVLFSERPMDTDGQIAFTRASNATRVDANGLVEKVRTNLALYSEQFDNSAWSKAGSGTGSAPVVTANAALAPDGTTTAERIVLNQGAGLTSGDFSAIQQAISGTQIGTFSVWMKSATGTTYNVALRIENTLQSFAVTSDWQRFELPKTTTASLTSGIWLRGGYSTDLYADIYAWGAQVETGDIATEYIPTTTSARSTFAGTTVDGTSVPNLPRIDYSGTEGALLLEPQRTNLALYSEQFDNAAWTKASTTITANVTTSPDGTQNADKLVESATSAIHYCETTVSVTSGQSYSYSVYAKQGERHITLQGSATPTNSAYATFNLSTGVVGASDVGSASIIDAGNGWYRCTLTFTSAATSGANMAVLLADSPTAGRSSSYSGDGTSGVFLWGAQMEASSYPTSYIPTLGTSVTALADNCVKTSASSIIGQTKGVVYFDLDFRRLTNAGIRNFCSLEGSVSSQFSGFSLATTNNGNDIFAAGATYNLSEGRHKVAYLYDSTANVSKLFVDGALRGTSTFSAFLATIDRVSVGARVNPYAGMALDRHQNGEFSSFLLFPDTLSNEELATLTTL